MMLLTDDITFCSSECDNVKCYRNPNNIIDRRYPHSYADFKFTKECPSHLVPGDENWFPGQICQGIILQVCRRARFAPTSAQVNFVMKNMDNIDDGTLNEIIKILGGADNKPEDRWKECYKELETEGKRRLREFLKDYFD